LEDDEVRQKMLSSETFSAFVEYLKEQEGRDVSPQEAMSKFLQVVNLSTVSANAFGRDYDTSARFLLYQITKEDETNLNNFFANEFVTLYKALS
jgi:hypothetical protein